MILSGPLRQSEFRVCCREPKHRLPIGDAKIVSCPFNANILGRKTEDVSTDAVVVLPCKVDAPKSETVFGI